MLMHRVALVTGGARRLGREIALALGRAGADVAISFHDSEDAALETERSLKDLGRRAAAVRCDVRSGPQVEQLVRRVTDALGPIGVLVVNAAVFKRTPLAALGEEEWNRHFDVNTHGAFRCAREVGLRMKKRGGTIIFIADVAGMRPWPSYLPYSASKASVIALTRGLAIALAPRVRVNAVAPGPVLPPEDFTAKEVQQAVAKTLLRRTGRAADVAEAVLYLASAQYVTGTVLPVDGGRHLG